MDRKTQRREATLQPCPAGRMQWEKPMHIPNDISLLALAATDTYIHDMETEYSVLVVNKKHTCTSRCKIPALEDQLLRSKLSYAPFFIISKSIHSLILCLHMQLRLNLPLA